MGLEHPMTLERKKTATGNAWQSQSGSTMVALQSAQVYADAVVASHLPDKERIWRLSYPTTRPQGGRMITLNEEYDYDRMAQERNDGISFATNTSQYVEAGRSNVSRLKDAISHDFISISRDFVVHFGLNLVCF